MSLKTKLKSRKFWIGLILVILGSVMWATGDRENGVNLIVLGGVSYLGMEGIADIVSRATSAENAQVDEDEKETDIQ